MSYEFVQLELQGSTALITLNRPDVLNAMSVELTTELCQIFNGLCGNDEVRVVVLTGAGRAFCAGGDVKQMATILDSGNPADHFRDPLVIYNRLITTMRELPKPIIAAVNGMAAGAGFNLALACDVRIASESAVFSQAFIRIGLIPDCGGTFFLPRIVGAARALEFMLTAEPIDAERAKELGIVNMVVKEQELLETAQFFATQAANMPTATIGRLKKLINASLSNTLEEQLNLEAQMQLECAKSKDFVEGVRAFVEKRQPKFTGC